MEDFEYVLTIHVKVRAYDESDAKDIVNEMFGPGEDCGVDITDLKIRKA